MKYLYLVPTSLLRFSASSQNSSTRTILPRSFNLSFPVLPPRCAGKRLPPGSRHCFLLPQDRPLTTCQQSVTAGRWWTPQRRLCETGPPSEAVPSSVIPFIRQVCFATEAPAAPIPTCCRLIRLFSRADGWTGPDRTGLTD